MKFSVNSDDKHPIRPVQNAYIAAHRRLASLAARQCHWHEHTFSWRLRV